MATQKRLNARIIPKHDIETNWNKAINFIPLKGEIVLYDSDENYSYPRIKQGDGVTQVTQLPFVTDYLPHTSIEKVDYTRLTYKSNHICEVIPGPEGSGYVMVKGKRLGLVEGEVYKVECYEYFNDDGVRLENPVESAELDVIPTSEGDWLTYAEDIVPPVGTLWLTDWHYFDIFDGVIFNDDGELVEGEGYVYFIGTAAHSFGNIETIIHNIPSIDYVYHKIDGNLLPTSQFFDGDSMLPQSGQAVAGAMNTAINRSKPNISQTLGDGHIKAQYDSNSLKTYLYTEGIGFNDNLQTANKDTLVDAINELDYNIKNRVITLNGKNIINAISDNATSTSVLSDYVYDDVPPTALGTYDPENKLNTSKYRLLTCPVNEGIIYTYMPYNPSYDSSSGVFYTSIECYIDYYENKGMKLLKRFYICKEDYLELLNHKYLSLIALKDLNDNAYNAYIINVMGGSTSTKNIYSFSGWNNNYKLYRNEIVGGSVLFVPAIDNSGRYSCEFSVVKRYGVINQDTIKIYPLTIGENGTIVTDTLNELDSGIKLTTYSDCGKCTGTTITIDNTTYRYYNVFGNQYILIDEKGNVIAKNCQRPITTYDNYLIFIQNNNTSENKIVVYDPVTSSIVKKIPTNFNSSSVYNMIIIDDYIYLYYHKKMFKAPFNYDNIIGVTYDNVTPNPSSSDSKFIKYKDKILVIDEDKVYNHLSPLNHIYYYDLRKELKFNEADIPSIETINTGVTKNYKDSPVVINNISPVEHDIKVKVTGKNLIDISKIPATSESTAKNYVSEVGKNYIVISTTEDYEGNGVTGTGVNLKELCPQLEVGKTYIINGETTANHKLVHFGPPAGTNWAFNTQLTITEDILNSQVYFYGLSTYVEQGYGDCKTSNIQVYEADKIVTGYTPYVDISSVNVNVYGKNLFDEQWEVGALNTKTGEESTSSNSIRTVNYIKVKPNTTYTVSLPSGRNYYPIEYTKDFTFAFYSSLRTGTFTFTTSANTTYVRFMKFGDTEIPTNVQMELGDTATEYEPYFNENYSPDIYGNVTVPYVPYTTYIDIDSDKVYMSVLYNKKLNDIYHDIQELQAVNKSLEKQLNEKTAEIGEIRRMLESLQGNIDSVSLLVGGPEQ